MVTASNAATVAENKPVYVFRLSYAEMEAEDEAHENQDPICRFLPEFGNSIVLFLSDLRVHGVEWP